jgi:hypothetical protein
MEKYLLPLSIGCILATLLLLIFRAKANANLIDLRNLFWRAERSPDIEKWQEDANFIEMTDGTILFFQPSMRKKLRSIMRKETSEYKGTFQWFIPSTKESAIEVLNVSEINGSLKIGHWTAKASELDRLVISPDWQNVYNYCASLFPGPKGYSGLSSSSIIRLKGSLFLITGGATNRRHPTPSEEEMESTATIFDASSGQAVRSFRLCQRHRRHMSVLLPDGNVLLLGTYGLRTIEIVDPNTCTSRILTCQFNQSRWCSTACLDRQGNCIVLAGVGTPGEVATRIVEKIDIANELITRLPDLASPREFMLGGSKYRVHQNALVLPDDSIIVSAGLKKFQTPMGTERNLAAEVYHPSNLPNGNR